MLRPLNKINTVLLTINIVMVSVFLVLNSDCGLSGEVVGTYDIDDSFIKVKGDGKLPQEILEICAHEVGHYVWYEYLSEADRAEYEAIYNVI
ncbi:MAG: hypothetical protein GY786_01865 [Proteobacteria bacterium]|nr:hypothetical protein [Pseudomonadota bacterium]